MKKKKVIIGMFLSVMAICFFSRSAQAEVSSISLLANYVSVGGDEKRFRQNLWMDDNFNGGIEKFNLKQNLGGGKNLTMEGSVLSDSDYKFFMNLEKNEFGYMNLKYDQFRKYYDDSGLYHVFPTAGLPSWYELDKNLYTDRSAFSLDFGLTIPDRPKYTLGYDRRTKSGEMASGLGIGVVKDRNPAIDDVLYMYPYSNNIDWVVDTLKVGTEFKIKEFNISLKQRFEAYTNNSFADNVFEVRENTSPVWNNLRVEEQPSYQTSTSTILADSQVNEKLYMKGGYLFNSLAGKDKWDRTYYGTALSSPARYYNGEEDNDLDSNVFSWGMNLNPIKDLSFTTRLRYEKSKTSASSQFTKDGSSSTAGNGIVDYIQRESSREEKSGVAEGIGLRYSALLRTTFYMDMDWEQSQINYTNNLWGVPGSATPTTDNYNRDKDFNKDVYTVGVNTRPIKPLFISSRYRRTNKDNEYTVYDTEGIVLGNNSRRTDEYTVRTEIKPNKLIVFSAKYQNSQANYDLSSENPDGIGTFDSQTTSFGVTLTPTPKLYINSLYSFQDAMIRSEGTEAVLARRRVEYYNGDSNTAITTVNYALDNKTIVNTQYQRWAADGTDAVSQGIFLGLERSLSKGLVLKVGYSYNTYDEGENSGIDDYKANIVYTSLTGKF